MLLSLRAELSQVVLKDLIAKFPTMKECDNMTRIELKFGFLPVFFSFLVQQKPINLFIGVPTLRRLLTSRREGREGGLYPKVTRSFVSTHDAYLTATK